MSQFGVHITDNQSPAISRGNIGPMVEGLRFSSCQPGGNMAASFRVPVSSTGVLRTPAWLDKFYRLDITDQGRYLWSGQLETIELQGGTGGRWWNVTAAGFGAQMGDMLAAPAGVEGQQTSDLVQTLATALGIFDTVTVTASGFTLSAAPPINLPAMLAMARIRWAAAFGDTSFRPQLWYVYPVAATGALEFTFGPRPTTPDYEGYLSDFESYRFGLQGQQLYNRVTVVYNNGISTATVDNTNLQAPGPTGWNRTREAVRFLPHIGLSLDALQAANLELAARSAGRMAATSLAVPSGRRLPLFFDSNRQPVPAWWLQAGRLFRFLDVDPNDASTSLGFLNSFLIDEVEFNEDSAELTLRPESPDTLTEAALAAVRQFLGGRLTLE